ncbi:PTS fructose transporter subunit IIBC [Actinomadura vinacea]|uniref:PTS fructose transporter subunit IIBC n=1 Tax=Actinomadura vinacea TaxID=115336 RepID=A0ABP5WMQ7_9ACTN
MRVVAITACPTGIAHTYMAAEKLSRAGADHGHRVRVETHGAIGVEDELTAEEIEAADAVVIAADQDVDTARFAGKRLIKVSVAAAIKDPAGLIEQALAAPPPDGPAPGGPEPKTPSQKAKERSFVYRNLMNGVSYMIPFVVVGGLLIAVSLAVAGNTTPDGLKIPEGSFWFKVNEVGVASFQFMVPILAGYIAYAIADRPGLAPGVIGGYVAATGTFYDSEAGTGFIGGIIAGFAAGFTARWIKSWRVPDMLKPIMPILVIPILSTLVVAALFIWVIGQPIGGLMEDLTGVLRDMRGSKLVLGAVLGAMIAFDMGGPVNKVAFLFGAGLIVQGEYTIMGACAVAICVPPLGLGLATLIRRDRFTGEEQEAGKAALAMGLVGITEGAIPFAAADPLRVIPANMAGGIVGGAIAATAGVLDHVPHGGPVVAVLGAIGGVPMFLVAALAGIAVTAATVLVLKRPVPQAVRQAEAV